MIKVFKQKGFTISINKMPKKTKGKKIDDSEESNHEEVDKKEKTSETKKTEDVKEDKESNEGKNEKVYDTEEKRWEQEQDRKPKILDFDEEEITNLDKEKTSDITDIDLLKILYLRGQKNFNPILRGEVKRTLLILSGEGRRHFNNGRGRGGYRQRGDGRRDGYRPREQHDYQQREYQPREYQQREYQPRDQTNNGWRRPYVPKPNNDVQPPNNE